MFLRYSLVFALLVASCTAAAYQNGVDLISLHYDHAPDKDDGHATVAALMVTTKLGITPHVVSGAYGQFNKSKYLPAAERVMQATWQNNWLNAHSNWQSSVNSTAAKWTQTINSGGQVYVAEGGQADFTADVVRAIRNNTSINTKAKITVVQHSTWNEQQANQADLNYVKNQTNYVKIADGNNVNATADLNAKSTSFVAKARSGKYSTEWTAAFQYLNPNNKLDFSDTVELLHILDIGKNVIATVNDFGDEFFEADSVNKPSSPTAWSDSYSVGGQCYCDTTFDHALGNIKVDTQQGQKTVRQVCSAIKNKYGTGPAANRVYYNTAQCGHGPANNAPDEAACPGIPVSVSNYTGAGCQLKGATWNLNDLYPTIDEEPPAEDPAAEEPTNAQDPEFPACSATVTDDNNDGYGWENDQTCAFTDTAPAQTPIIDIIEFPACSATVTDDNNDGYGWENEQTCAFTDTAPAQTPVTDIIEFPTCTATAVDSDGDGYAWENNQTCVIDSNANQAQTNSDGFPICSATIVDIDGDGYAWENFQTCAMDAATAQQQDQNQSAVSLVFFPLCSSAIVDSDSDGYGWENHQTCTFNTDLNNQAPLAAVTFPACSTTVIDHDSDGYGWENDQTCFIAQSDSLQQSTLTLVNFPACSTDIVDDNGDGYGWENHQTCQITGNAGSDVVYDAIQLALLTFPACSSELTDYEGDGYGWENNQSCVFNPQANDSTFTNTISLSGYIYPVCSQTATDDNQDGFAWENNTTCVIPGSVPILLELAKFPICSAGVQDENQDGYGWENHGSCRFEN